MKLWLYIHFPRLALEGTFTSTSPNMPRLLLSSGKRKVIQCNDPAAAHGIELGMALNTAYCLIPEVETVTYDAQLERDKLEQLAFLTYRMSSHISLQPPDGLLLEIHSMLNLFGGLQGYWDCLHRILGKTFFSFTCATGHTAQTAKVLALNFSETCSDSKITHQEALSHLRVSQLGLDRTQVKRLNAMGVRRYSDLIDLPIKELGYRYGSGLVSFIQSFELDTENTPLFTVPLRFHHRIDLHHEVVCSKGLLFPLKPVLEYLERYLQHRQLQTDRLFLLLEYRSKTTTRLVIRAVTGAWKSRAWLELIAIQLERLILEEPILAFQVRVHRFIEQAYPGKDLLGGQTPDIDANQLLSVLISRLGYTRVCLPSATADSRPEQAGELKYALTESLNQLKPCVKPHPVFLMPRKRCWPIKNYQIMHGPERIVSGWWDEQPSREDFYSARSNLGVFSWLLCSDNRQWFYRGGYG